MPVAAQLIRGPSQSRTLAAMPSAKERRTLQMRHEARGQESGGNRSNKSGRKQSDLQQLSWLSLLAWVALVIWLLRPVMGGDIG